MKKKKRKKYSIWNSSNPIKNTSLVRAYCIRKGMQHELIGNLPYEEFLNRLTDNKYFIFLPETLETLCRVAVECKMAGMTVLTNKKIGGIQRALVRLKRKRTYWYNEEEKRRNPKSGFWKKLL